MSKITEYNARKELEFNGIHWYISELNRFGIVVLNCGGPLYLVKGHYELQYYTYDVNIVILYNSLSEGK